MTTISMRQKDIRPAPARIEFKGMKFLITDRPSDATIQSYLMVSFVKPRPKSMNRDTKSTDLGRRLDSHQQNILCSFFRQLLRTSNV